MVRAHGGDPRCVDKTALLPRTAHRIPILAARSGWVCRCEPRALAWVALEMGAGRVRAEQRVDHAVGIELAVQYGEYVERNQPLAFLHVRKPSEAETFGKRVRAAFGFSHSRPKPRKLVLGVVT